MLNVLIRFIIVYFLLLFFMKILGKRQIGEMQMSELTAAFFFSEFATEAIKDTDDPLYFALLPVILMTLIEVAISYLAVKNPVMKRVFDSTPSILIRDGAVQEKALLKNRITIDEMLSFLRLSGFYDLNRVQYAILEPNGQISVVPYAKYDAVCCEDLGLPAQEDGFSMAIIDDGRINQKALEAIGKNEKWLKRILNQSKVASEKEVFLLSSDFSGNWKLVKKTQKS